MLKLALEEDREDFVRMCKNFFDKSPFKGMTFARTGIDAVFSTHLVDKTQAIVILYNVDGKNVGMIAGIASSPLFAEEAIASELAWWVDEDYRNNRESSKLIYAFEDWAVRVGAYGSSLASIKGFSPEGVIKFYERLGYVEQENNYLKVF